MRRAFPITLTDDERTTLVRWARGRRTPACLVLRAKIVLRAAAGLQNKDIAAELRTDRECVGRWRTRFATHRWPPTGRPGRWLRWWGSVPKPFIGCGKPMGFSHIGSARSSSVGTHSSSKS